MNKYKTKKNVKDFLDVAFKGCYIVTRESRNNLIKKHLSFTDFEMLLNETI